MKFSVFLSPKGDYLLVPDCLKASREAERLHGPLVSCGEIDSDDHPLPDLWATVMEDVDARLYSVVNEVVATALLGIDCTTSARKRPTGPVRLRVAP